MSRTPLGCVVFHPAGWTLSLGLACLLLPGLLHAQELNKPASIEEQATHFDSGKLNVSGINAFAINKEGQILAASGTGPGTIKILTPAGAIEHQWKVDFKPEAINSTPAGDILVGGVGRLQRYTSEGKLVHEGEAPHIAAMKTQKAELRKEVVSRLNNHANLFNPEQLLAQYETMLADLEKRKKTEALNASEEQILKVLPQYITQLEEQVAEHNKKKTDDQPQQTGPSEEEIQKELTQTIQQKSRIASISTDGKNVFVATPATVGWGYSVWKMADDFTSGEEIVKDLRGCCGHMDVQCCENGLYVAENARHRVVCYDNQGQQRVSWGQSDRTGLKGFTSCCNPMNICFNSEGDVYTAESTTGRIKRFDKDGQFLDFVGDVKLVPGCKNVSIAVSPDASRIYMLDITRGHIVVMSKYEGERPAIRKENVSQNSSSNSLSEIMRQLIPASSAR